MAQLHGVVKALIEVSMQQFSKYALLSTAVMCSLYSRLLRDNEQGGTLKMDSPKIHFYTSICPFPLHRHLGVKDIRDKIRRAYSKKGYESLVRIKLTPTSYGKPSISMHGIWHWFVCLVRFRIILL